MYDNGYRKKENAAGLQDGVLLDIRFVDLDMPKCGGNGLASAERHELHFLGTAADILEDLLRG